MNHRIIGIMGGMGPEATADLFLKIIKATRVEKDQDHFRVIIDSNPKIPDRTAAILGKGESPVSAMVETGKNLEKLGVDIIVMPCNTAHYFIDQVQRQLSTPIVNVLEKLYKYIKSNYPKVKRVGLLATTGTIKTGLYSKYMKDLEVICPSEDTQKHKVMEAIYGDFGIKKGYRDTHSSKLLIAASNELIEKEAEMIIAGCTEICLSLKSHHISKPLIDPMDVIAHQVTGCSQDID